MINEAATDQEIQKYQSVLLAHQTQLLAIQAEEAKLFQEMMAEYIRREAAKDAVEITAKEANKERPRVFSHQTLHGGGLSKLKDVNDRIATERPTFAR